MASQIQGRLPATALFLFLLLAVLSVPGALANQRMDNDGQVPFYARFGRDELFTDGQHAVIFFYRPPECIPADFNMLDFFDFPGAGPGAFACNPPTTDGFEIWENGPETDAAPIHAVLHGLGSVPVWFVSLDELEDTMADDVVTVAELEALPSLQTGTASRYNEVLKPTQAAKNPMIAINASGKLDGGERFGVHISWSAASGESPKVKIDLGN